MKEVCRALSNRVKVAKSKKEKNIYKYIKPNIIHTFSPYCGDFGGVNVQTSYNDLIKTK